MKELIYRRAGADTGYQTVRCAAEISPAVRSTVTEVAEPAFKKAQQEEICYLQFRLEGERVVLGVNYADVHGSRNSRMMQLLITADAKESRSLFAGYPGRGRFFEDFRARYAEAENLDQMPQETEIDVRDFLGSGGLADAFAQLRELFDGPEALAAMFEALLDAASNNPKMVVIFGPNEDGLAMARRGKRIVESLLACLPPVLASHLGYIVPTVSDEGNAMFGVRYSGKRNISNSMRPFTYTYELETRKFVAPNKANHAAAAYAAELAALVFEGAAGCERMRKLNEALNDAVLFDATDVPADIALRYRFSNEPDLIAEADRKVWLDWHHSAIANAEKKGGALGRSNFWSTVDNWVIGWMLGDIYAHASAWRDADPVYCRNRVREIYVDGQRLFALNRGEAAAYERFFAKRLEENRPLDAAGQQMAERELIRSFAEQIRRSTDGEFASRGLYWSAIERWIRQRWAAGQLVHDRGVQESVQRLYALDPEAGAAYVPAFAEYCQLNNVSLLALVQSEFGEAVYRRILEKNPDLVADRASRELGGQDPFADEMALARYLQYRKMMGNEPRLRPAYLRLCNESLKHALAKCQAEDAQRLFAELEGPQGGIIDTFHLMNPDGDARAQIEQRLYDLVRDEGIYPVYPQQPELAKDIARLLDRRAGTPAWARRLSVLERVHALKLEELDEENFDRLMEEGFGSEGDARLNSHAQRLLWEAIQKSFTGNGNNMEALLRALALHNSRSGSFRPMGILADLEKLELAPKKLYAFCKHRAEPGARRGLAYVARAMNATNVKRRDGEPQDVWLDYPGARVARRRAGMFEGIPTVAAAIAAAVFAAGLAGSVVGLLNGIGML